MRKAVIYLGLRVACEANGFISALDAKKKLKSQSSANSDRPAITGSPEPIRNRWTNSKLLCDYLAANNSSPILIGRTSPIYFKKFHL
jgi:hypothetical protein